MYLKIFENLRWMWRLWRLVGGILCVCSKGQGICNVFYEGAYGTLGDDLCCFLKSKESKFLQMPFCLSKNFGLGYMAFLQR